MLSEPQRIAWEKDGCFVVEGFASPKTCKAMLDRVVEIAREAEGAGYAGNALVIPETKRDSARVEENVSKVFRLHRDGSVFERFCREPRLLSLLTELLAPDLDCFLSQFIFKAPGAPGQPWHQDSYYFPFDRGPQVGVWLAVTEATPDNGPLHVLRGSHGEPVHDAVPDTREGYAARGYVEIVDQDTAGSEMLLLKPGDLLVFHSHLMHKSTDNESDRLRAAMVYHYAEGGTVEKGESLVHDWMPVQRGGAPA